MLDSLRSSRVPSLRSPSAPSVQEPRARALKLRDRFPVYGRRFVRLPEREGYFTRDLDGFVDGLPVAHLPDVQPGATAAERRAIERIREHLQLRAAEGRVQLPPDVSHP